MAAIKLARSSPVEQAPPAQLWLEVPAQASLARQQLWLSVQLPLLGFYALRLHQEHEPLALTEGEGSYQRIYASNTAAQSFGVKSGMKISTATSLCGQLNLHARDHEREQIFLQRLARWAQQFTPTVSVHASQHLLLEIAASVHLFQGEQQLCSRLLAALQQRGLSAHLALANTPLASIWLNRARSEWALDHDKSTVSRLSSLPLAVSDIDEKVQQHLQAVGIQTLGELMRLPRDGLMRRYGKSFLQLLDRAYGKVADIPPIEAAPHHFDERIELSYECSEVMRLMPVVQELVQHLCQRLRAVQCGVSTFDLIFHHKVPDKTVVTIGLALPSREPEPMLRLCQAKLEALILQQPTRELQLKAHQWMNVASENHDHFKRRSGRADIAVLIEQLRARMTDDGAYQLSCIADHRAEYSQQSQSVNQAKVAMTEPFRPLYLLSPPQALNKVQSLTIIHGPERIEGGWWNQNDIKRDYYIARTPHNEWWWIFRDRRNKQWFKHGVFA